MKTKEQWIRETMDSLNGIHSAEANPYLYDKITQRLQNQNGKVLYIQPKLIFRMAACIAILLLLNVFSLIHYRKATVGVSNNSNPVASEYFSYMHTIQL